jgi:hypothetical protein
MQGGIGAEVYGQPVGRRLSLPLGRCATDFQAEVFAILACTHDIKNHGTTEKQVSICSDSLAALKALCSLCTHNLKERKQPPETQYFDLYHSMAHPTHPETEPYLPHTTTHGLHLGRCPPQSFSLLRHATTPSPSFPVAQAIFQARPFPI